MKIIFPNLLFLIIFLGLFTPSFTIDSDKNGKSDNHLLKKIEEENILKMKIDIDENNPLILQSFYWAVPESDWYNIVNSRLNEIRDLGFTYLWLPPPSKTYGGGSGLQMGYEPFDYYDLGEFDQQGNISTRFGSKSELISLLNNSKSLGLNVMADIVMNHNRGGIPEPNGLNFTNIASGLFKRNESDFNCGDGQVFADFPDLCTTKQSVRQQLIEWGHWLQDEIGYNGWRFDFVKGYNSSTVNAWIDSIDGLSVIEYWENDVGSIMAYLDKISASQEVKAFDFPLLYTLRDVFFKNGNFNMRNLDSPTLSILATNGSKSVSFVANHDTVRDAGSNLVIHRDFAYAFILMQADTTPSIFWRDLYPKDSCPIDKCQDQLDVNSNQLQDKLRILLNIRKNYAAGSGTTIYSDSDVYIYQRNGDPGLLLALNDNPKESHTVTVTSKWNNVILYDLTGNQKALQVDSLGNVTLIIPPLSYLIYSTIDEPNSYVLTDILTLNQSSTETVQFIDNFTFILTLIMIFIKKMKKKY
jgi:alpha-amylase